MYKPERLSMGAEKLLAEWARGPAARAPYDVVIVGSGYGGAIAAAKLAAMAKNGEALDVCVLERGREHLPGTFPNSFSQLPGHVRLSRFDDPSPMGVREGLFDFRIGEDVSVLVASGLGGGSLINAGVAATPEPDVFEDEHWPEVIRREAASRALFARYEDLREVLKATKAKVVGLRKHEQFVKLAQSWRDPGPANITVNADRCVNCGDCATGCNFDAKQTLSKTRLERAYEKGAHLYTGATVSHLEKRGDHWGVLLGLTVQPHPLQEKQLREIRARTVILAAGALGSTEILMRSRQRSPGLGFSSRLGTRFSINGDMISARYGQNEEVRSAPEEHSDFHCRKVGPTITGIATVGTTREERVVIEELAIPGALRRVFEEVVTTCAMLDRFGQRDDKEHPEMPEVDPAAVNPELINKCQVFAAMGDDGAQGRLEPVPGWDQPKYLERVNDGAVRIDWPGAGNAKIYNIQEKALSCANACGGRYLRNPLWRPFPAGVAQALSGAKPSGKLFSVHPLGGCPMGENVNVGVVDHMGRVFDPAGEFHDGLLVLDGSIVPTALGTNPFLTIAVLADRAVGEYSKARGWTEHKKSSKTLPPLPPLDSPVPPEAKTVLGFEERMAGELSLRKGGPKLGAELTLKFDAVEDLPGFLRNPARELKGRGALRLQEGGANQTIAVDDVRVKLLARAHTRPLDRIRKALSAYWKNRSIDALEMMWQGHAGITPGRALWAAVRGLVGKQGVVVAVLDAFPTGRGFVNVASQVGEVRHLEYAFKLGTAASDPAGNTLPQGTVIHGRKTIEYAAGGNPWRQLVDVELWTGSGKDRAALGTLSVDPAYFFDGFASRLYIAKQRDLPSAWMDLASLGLFLARVILKIHFWSFRLPNYQPYDPERDRNRMPGPIESVHMQRYVVGYPRTPEDEPGVFLLLTRYRRNRDKPGKPVLLVHGLGSGGTQFATHLADPSLAQYLADRGFDVWVAELRTSIALPSSLDQWTIDEVARGDIPRLVDFVLKEAGVRQVDVVAHCIGSAMFCTAVLDGRLQHASGESKIRSAALLQVGPLITLSKGTRLRSLVTAPLRRFLPDGHVDFSVDDRAGWVEAMIDRLLATYPYPKEEAKHHELKWFGDSRFHIANCNRWAAIDGRMFLHENLAPKMLSGLGEILGHSSLTTWTQTIQYAALGRLTDSNGSNAYVTTENVRRYFDFPVRFLHGAENDVFHPLTSWRSQELLKRVHGKEFPAEVCILAGYSHLDPLLGKNAGKDVFEKIRCFLELDHDLPEASRNEPEHFYFRRPLIGPVAGWLRREGEAWWLRSWCRLDDLRSPASFALVAVFDGQGNCLAPPRRIPCPSEKVEDGKIESSVVGPFGTTLCVDVELGCDPGRYEVMILSAHHSTDEEVPEPHRKAERDAGARISAPKPHWSGRDGPTRDKLEEIRKARPDPDESKLDRATVTVPGAAKDESLTFAVASCRYPGWLFDRDRADAVFGGMLDRLEQDDPPRALFLVGDQIYADATAGVFDPKDRRERYYEAYREAWTAPCAGKVLSRLPVYMMMDDHECGDDWHPDDPLGAEEAAMRREGLKAFRDYQWVHSPGNKTGSPGLSKTGREILYYDFDLEGFPFFVCDTRTGRGPDRILDEGQFQALTDWLKAAPEDRPKFVVSPSVVVPFLQSSVPPADYPRRSDGWDSCPGQLRDLFGFILKEEIDNVVFLCGDPHLSMSAKVRFKKKRRVQGLSCDCIVASPMYAPYPFANATARQFVNGRLDLGAGKTMTYRITACKEGDSFSLVTARRDARGRWTVACSVLP